jgi:hypothetical protein
VAVGELDPAAKLTLTGLMPFAVAAFWACVALFAVFAVFALVYFLRDTRQTLVPRRRQPWDRIE